MGAGASSSARQQLLNVSSARQQLLNEAFNARQQPGFARVIENTPNPNLNRPPVPVYRPPEDDNYDDELTDDMGCRCPITQEIMRDPVICADGHSYDRGAIHAWLQAHDTSPLTGSVLNHKMLTPNHALRSIIDERRMRRQQAMPTLPAPVAAQSSQVTAAAAGGGDSSSTTTWRIDPSRLDVSDKVLGRGAWGVVRLGFLLEGGERTAVAVKMLPEAPDSVAANLESEIEILALATIRCTHVCRLIGTCFVEGTIALVMKKYECSLHDVLEGAPAHTLPLATALRLGTQLAQAIGELHECKIILRDLKPANVLLDEWGNVAVSDFGISTRLETTLSRMMPTSIKGTTSYMPPEAFDPEQFGGLTVASDIWALGCCLVEMLSGEAPWHGLPHMQVLRRVCDKRETPPIPSGLPPRIDTMLRRCFAHAPLDRPDAREVHSTLVNAANAPESAAGSATQNAASSATQAASVGDAAIGGGADAPAPLPPPPSQPPLPTPPEAASVPSAALPTIASTNASVPSTAMSSLSSGDATIEYFLNRSGYHGRVEHHEESSAEITEITGLVAAGAAAAARSAALVPVEAIRGGAGATVTLQPTTSVPADTPTSVPADIADTAAVPIARYPIPPRPAPPTVVGTATRAPRDANVSRLVEMGFAEELATVALAAANGDVREAAASLMDEDAAYARMEAAVQNEAAAHNVAAAQNVAALRAAQRVAVADQNVAALSAAQRGAVVDGSDATSSTAVTGPSQAAHDASGNGDVTWHVAFNWSPGELPSGTQSRSSLFGGGRRPGDLEKQLGVKLIDGDDGMPTVSSVRAGAVAAQQVAVGDRILTVNGESVPSHDVKRVERMLLDAMHTPPLMIEMQARRRAPAQTSAGGEGEQSRQQLQSQRRGVLGSVLGGGRRDQPSAPPGAPPAATPPTVPAAEPALPPTYSHAVPAAAPRRRRAAGDRDAVAPEGSTQRGGRAESRMVAMVCSSCSADVAVLANAPTMRCPYCNALTSINDEE